MALAVVAGRHLLLLALPLVIYAQVAGFSFVRYDDYGNVAANPHLDPPSWRNLGELWRAPYYGVYAPLTSTLWSIEAALARETVAGGGATLDPMTFHVGNLLLFLVLVQLVYLLLRDLVVHAPAACAGALIFAAHPLMAESVSWVTETKGLLSAVFGVLALWAYVGYVAAVAAGDGPTAGQRHAAKPALGYYLGATVAFLAALLAKPSAVAIPPMAMALEVIWLRRSFRASVLGLAPWLAAAVALAVVTSASQTQTLTRIDSPFYARPILTGHALAFYFYKLALPIWLGPDYGYTPGAVYSGWWGMAAGLVPLAAAAGLILLRPPRQIVAAVVVSLAALAPVSGLIPFAFQETSTVADRYFLLAMLGPSLAVAYLGSVRWTPAVWGTLAVLVIVLAGRSFLAARTWRDSLSLAEHGLRLNPTSVSMHNLLGLALEERGGADEALVQFRKGAELNPQSPKAHAVLGDALARRGKLAEAVAAYQRALDIEGVVPGAIHSRLAMAQMAVGQFGPAAESFRVALRASPDSAELYRGLGEALSHQGDLGGATQAMRRAVELKPDDAQAWALLGHLQHAVGQIDAALTSCRRAIALDPSLVTAHVNLGALLADIGHSGEAIVALRRALRIDPDNSAANISLGTVLVNQGILDEAAQCYQAALRATPDDANAHYNLAVVLSRQRRASQAAHHFRAALLQNPQHVAAMVGLGQEYELQGRRSEALEQLRAALKLEPGNPLIHNLLGVLWQRHGDREQARACFEEALRLDPSYADAKQNLANLER